MAENKTKRLRGQALKDANSAISKLRKAGLYAGKKAIGQPTKYALSLIKKFSDVIRGTAKAVKADTATRKAYSDVFRTKGEKIIIPVKPQNAELVRVIPAKETGKPGKITIYGDNVSGARYKRTLAPGKGETKARDLRSMEGPGVLFAVPIMRGRKGTQYRYFDKYDDAAHMIGEYVRRSAPKSASEAKLNERIIDWQSEIEVVTTRERSKGLAA